MKHKGTSKKIEEHINTGLWAQNDQGIIASVFDDIGGDGGRYVVNYHREGFPAYKSVRLYGLNEVESRMREFEPDLRRWHYRM